TMSRFKQVYENGKNPRQRYLWVPLFRDHDVIVTRRDSAIRYTNPNSLIGTRFGGLIGHTYNGIDELVAQGKIIREDASLEAALIHRVLLKRVDSVVVQGSAMKYLKRHILPDDKMNQLRISQPYFQEVQAEAMIPPGRQDVQLMFEQLVQSVEWQALLDRYDIEALTP
ncbi:MAG: hypothetical protein MI864_14670, partial [Pseudomonadales bacterium]|nr:hypothetical protein [Pseudomonadales bacterium]